MTGFNFSPDISRSRVGNTGFEAAAKHAFNAVKENEKTKRRKDDIEAFEKTREEMKKLAIESGLDPLDVLKMLAAAGAGTNFDKDKFEKSVKDAVNAKRKAINDLRSLPINANATTFLQAASKAKEKGMDPEEVDKVARERIKSLIAKAGSESDLNKALTKAENYGVVDQDIVALADARRESVMYKDSREKLTKVEIKGSKIDSKVFNEQLDKLSPSSQEYKDLSVRIANAIEGVIATQDSLTGLYQNYKEIKKINISSEAQDLKQIVKSKISETLQIKIEETKDVSEIDDKFKDWNKYSIISGDRDKFRDLVQQRVKDIYEGAEDKKAVYDELREKTNIPYELKAEALRSFADNELAEASDDVSEALSIDANNLTNKIGTEVSDFMSGALGSSRYVIKRFDNSVPLLNIGEIKAEVLKIEGLNKKGAEYERFGKLITDSVVGSLLESFNTMRDEYLEIKRKEAEKNKQTIDFYSKRAAEFLKAAYIGAGAGLLLSGVNTLIAQTLKFNLLGGFVSLVKAGTVGEIGQRYGTGRIIAGGIFGGVGASGLIGGTVNWVKGFAQRNIDNNLMQSEIDGMRASIRETGKMAGIDVEETKMKVSAALESVRARKQRLSKSSILGSGGRNRKMANFVNV